MNQNDTLTTIPTPAPPETAGRRVRTGARRPAQRLVVAVALALPILIGVLGTSTASAATVGGCWSNCVGERTYYDTPGGVTTNVACTAGRLTIMPNASAQAGYANGQYVTYRYQIKASNGYVGTSGWAGWTVAPSSTVRGGVVVQTPRTALPAASVPAAAGLSWTVTVQYAWYTSTGPVYSSFLAPTDGYQWRGTNRYYVNCYT